MLHEQAMALLPSAQAGDEEAKGRVALFVHEKYAYRVGRLHRELRRYCDPALSLDDMLSTFFEGIYRSIEDLDHRGDPMYFAGQRGVWAVLSELKAVRTMLNHRSFVPMDERRDDESATLLEKLVDRTQDDFREVVVSGVDAERAVKIMANADLGARATQALQVMIAGEAGDPEEPGFNKRLAAAMSISPQRASQVMNSLREGLA